MNLDQLDSQLGALVQAYDEIRKQTQYDDLSGGRREAAAAAQRLGIRAVAAVERLLPPGTAYRVQADAIVNTHSKLGAVSNPGGMTLRLVEVPRAFREDAAAGYLAAT